MKLIYSLPLFTLYMTTDVYGYLDGGTGGMIVQLILGGLAVGGSFIKIYWNKIKSIFVKKKD